MTIDVHGHLSPPQSLARYPMPRSLGDAEAMIEGKLAAGVQLTIIGSPVGGGAMVPVPGVDNYAQSVEDLARFHDWCAETVSRHSEHLRAYVYVNPYGGQAHLEAAAARLRTEQFVGLIVNSSVAGRYLDHADAADFFAMAAEADVPILLHAPAAPAAGTGLNGLMLLEQLGRFADVTIGLACIVMAGWLDKHPGLRLIGQGAGAALALLAERLDRAWSPEHWAGGPQAADGARPPGMPSVVTREKPSSYLRRISVDTATPSPATLDLALRTFGAERLLFGTDSPPLPAAAVADTLRLVDGLGLAAEQRAAVLDGNARRLFGGRLPKTRDPALARQESA